jgi:NAD(P)-dependent dehydrogenase (short-subunit alcohol dehydrogenase family)
VEAYSPIAHGEALKNAQIAAMAHKYHVPRAEHVIIGDLSDIDATKNAAEQANALGRFDAVIHNAGVYQAPPEDIFRVNILAPYL